MFQKGRHVRFKLIIAILLILVIIGYFIGFIGGAYIFVLFFPVASIAAFALGFFAIFLIGKLIVWAFFHVFRESSKKSSKLRKATNIIIGFVAFIFLITLTAKIFGNPGNRKIGNTSAIKALRTLPYVAWVPAQKTIKKRGVTKYNPDKAFSGVNICASIGAAGVHLIDMKGRVLHTWNANNMNDKWHAAVKLCQNGDLLAIAESRNLIRLDWNSNVEWMNKMRYHHEISIAENDDIYVLGRKDEVALIYGFPVPILNDYIAIISPDGKTKREIPIFKIVRKYVSFDIIPKTYRWITKKNNLKKILKLRKKHNYIFDVGSIFDIFHTNTITIMDRDIEGLGRKGDLIICIRELDLIGVVDIEKEELVWVWGPGELSRPHHPTLLENGNILIFDNGRIKGYSRIVELDPITKKIVWEYKDSPPQRFYSRIMGACQRLPNGNTLVTESDKSRIFEVTPDGEIVWEFYNPYIDLIKKKRAVIYRMMRITDSENYPNLDGLY